MILLDTNILLRSKQIDSPHYKEVTAKLIDLITNDEELAVCPQVLYEFYVVATRPIENNGLGLLTNEAIAEINNIIETYTLLDDNEDIFHNWLQLVEYHKVSGKTAHDTKIVALMQSHNVTKLYTINKKDFARFEPIIELI